MKIASRNIASAPQMQRLKAFIEYLRAQPDEAFIMQRVDCGTAACIFGHAIRFSEASGMFSEASGLPIELSSQFGISCNTWSDICRLDGLDMRKFDQLTTPGQRKDCMIAVLTDQLKRGWHDWLTTIVEHLPLDAAQEITAHKAL